ncbi:hypothetical protein [Kitasatospora sp. NPDC005856]|uniref:hypothetical protein n=1 Tax=Kitasatospora sp. NPDC005856 TaxID=3154566 RepID=UPI0033F6F059
MSETVLRRRTLPYPVRPCWWTLALRSSSRRSDGSPARILTSSRPATISVAVENITGSGSPEAGTGTGRSSRSICA